MAEADAGMRKDAPAPECGWLTMPAEVSAEPVPEGHPAHAWVTEAHALRHALAVASNALMLAHGAMRADAERLHRAATLVWGEDPPHDCDAPDWMADEVLGLRADLARVRGLAGQAMGLLDAHTDAYWEDEAVALRNQLADGAPAPATDEHQPTPTARESSEREKVEASGSTGSPTDLAVAISAAYHEGYDDAADRAYCEKHLRRNGLGHVEAHSAAAAEFFWRRSGAFELLQAGERSKP